MNGIDIVFDNNDNRIKHYELLLEGSLDHITEYALPVGYHFEFYQDGDRDIWIEIEKSAKEFSSYDEGLAAWNRYYAGRENELLDRMVFVVSEQGKRLRLQRHFMILTEKTNQVQVGCTGLP